MILCMENINNMDLFEEPAVFLGYTLDSSIINIRTPNGIEFSIGCDGELYDAETFEIVGCNLDFFHQAMQPFEPILMEDKNTLCYILKDDIRLLINAKEVKIIKPTAV